MPRQLEKYNPLPSNRSDVLRTPEDILRTVFSRLLHSIVAALDSPDPSSLSLIAGNSASAVKGVAQSYEWSKISEKLGIKRGKKITALTPDEYSATTRIVIEGVVGALEKLSEGNTLDKTEQSITERFKALNIPIQQFKSKLQNHFLSQKKIPDKPDLTPHGQIRLSPSEPESEKVERKKKRITRFLITTRTLTAFAPTQVAETLRMSPADILRDAKDWMLNIHGEPIIIKDATPEDLKPLLKTEEIIKRRAIDLFTLREKLDIDVYTISRGSGIRYEILVKFFKQNKLENGKVVARKPDPSLQR